LGGRSSYEFTEKFHPTGTHAKKETKNWHTLKTPVHLGAGVGGVVSSKGVGWSRHWEETMKKAYINGGTIRMGKKKKTNKNNSMRERGVTRPKGESTVFLKTRRGGPEKGGTTEGHNPGS